MAYWIYVTNSENSKITKQKNLLGVAERHRNILLRARIGDRCLVYVRGERTDQQTTTSKIVAEYEIASEVFESNTKVFHALSKKSGETFSLRVDLKLQREFEPPIEFKPLVPELAFFKNKPKWGLSLKGRAMIEIPKSDYDTIVSSASRGRA